MLHAIVVVTWKESTIETGRAVSVTPTVPYISLSPLTQLIPFIPSSARPKLVREYSN